MGLSAARPTAPPTPSIVRRVDVFSLIFIVVS
jgi:hypothetical protein